MTAKTFDAYEYIAVIAPGAIVALGLATEWSELRTLLADRGLTVGGLGLFLILSFALGHVTQAAGNLIETVVWACFGGMPSNWIRKPTQSLLAPLQRERLLHRLEQEQGLTGDLAAMSNSAWAGVVREIYSRASKASRTQRVDAFNRTYGLLRGLCAGFVLLAGVWVATGTGKVGLVCAAFAAAGAAGYRMYRFGRYYARELYVEYLTLPGPPAPP